MLITDITNTKDCVTIDTLQEGDDITITAIKRRGSGNKKVNIYFTQNTQRNP